MEKLNQLMLAQFAKMCETGKLFRVELSGKEIWDSYLNSFDSVDDPIFRDPDSSSHNCNHCNNFIRRYGNIVAIDENNNLLTLFDVNIDGEYSKTVNILSNTIKKSKIVDVFFETFEELNKLPYERCVKSNNIFRLGVDKNHKIYTKEEVEAYSNSIIVVGKTYTFNHFYLDLPKTYVDMSGKSVESIMSEYRSSKEVFQRAMEEISLDTLLLVRDLINQGSLLDGQTHLHKVEKFIPLKKEYDQLYNSEKNSWLWKTSFGLSIARFKNELIGVLCTEIAEGEELNKACQSWNKRVDPANYMKATAPITQKQISEAKKFVEENGYEESFDRRFATIDDIKVSEILHANVGDGKIKEVSIFDNVKSTSTRHKRSEFDGLKEVSIEKFMNDILPSATSVEVFLSNKHDGNMVSLTTAKNKDSKPIFKWDNNYSWTFNGNLAGKSQIKEAVKTAGGGVDGVLRFSMMWAESDGDNSDLDAHCIEPNSNLIYFGSKISHTTGGNLDIDITNPQSQMPKGAVENITYPSLNKMIDGVYLFRVNQYSASASKGFKAEIEFDGEIYSYEYNKSVSGNVNIARVTLKNGQFSIEHLLPESTSSKEIYGLQTNQFHKVNLVCLSPNHWGDNNVGNKHYLFMIDGAKADQSIRSFHNENLIGDLLQHRKVMEVLGTTNMIEPTSDKKQLSGLGFNATVTDELIVKVSGSHKRMLKIKFN